MLNAWAHRYNMNKDRKVDEVEAEIEASKVHWSEVLPASDEGQKLAANNAEVFESLKKQWPSDSGPKFSMKWTGRANIVTEKPNAPKSFWSWHYDDLVVQEKPFAGGGQADIFDAMGIDYDGELVLKVFKEGSSLRGLQKQWPVGMLGDESTRNSGYFSGGRYCNGILGGTLMKNGRFAFIMPKCWGDLRKLIDCRMKHNNSQGPPFLIDIATRCMWQIAKGMEDLHTRDLLHRDLKAANVFIQRPSRYKKFDSIHDNNFTCKVADFECSIGVMGTGFWRAPEILQFLKDRNNLIVTTSNTMLELFTTKSDVYSYAMTCYEILKGGIPFKEFTKKDFDVVIGGTRPKLPSGIQPWMEDLLNRCWDTDPSKRPPFKEIVKVLEANVGFQLDSTSAVII